MNSQTGISRTFPAVIALVAFAGTAAVSSATSAQTITGFTPAHAAAELGRERRFDADVDRAEMGGWIKRLSARPNHLGSPYDRDNAEYIRRLLASWGYDARIERFDVLSPWPVTRLLELTHPVRFRAGLQEAAIASDPVSKQTAEQLPSFVAYSIDGDVSAPLVYVNYGMDHDYAVLAERGVDVRGKIVIARYGASWRGEKPKLAAEHGAVGCILYTDPQDEGYSQGDVYPRGPWRNSTMVQRGSVEQIDLYPGDPLTPGVGATADAVRLPFATAAERRKIPVLTKIPVLPISYGDALPLLRALRGPVAPLDMTGTLPITYHFGAGPAIVHLKLTFQWKLRPAYDVIARLRGSTYPREVIVRGNHYDGWVNGAMDPHSGTAAELEEARIVAGLAKRGERPKRTILFAFWDGEEEGFIGSTEWVERHEHDLSRAAAYVGSDDLGRGLLSVAGSHSLEQSFEEIGHVVPDPDTKVSVVARQRAHARYDPAGTSPGDDGDGVHIGALGAGSDWTPFLDHIGVPSIFVAFNAETLWHSIYDSYAYVTKFADPGFRYSAAQAEITGRIVLRFADADVLPYAFAPFAATVIRYADELRALSTSTAATIAQRNTMIADGTYRAISDTLQTIVAPTPEAAPPRLDFAPLATALAALDTASKTFDRTLAERLASGVPPDAALVARIDAQTMAAERALLDPSGLPGRPWYRHEIYAPGQYSGYSAKTMPMIREGIELHRWTNARRGITVVAASLNRYRAAIERATALLR